MGFGGELVTNGTFDTDLSGWTDSPEGTFSWLSGKARYDSDVASSGSISQTVDGEAGKSYRVSLSISSVSGWTGFLSSFSVKWGGQTVISEIESVPNGNYEGTVVHNGTSDSLDIAFTNLDPGGGASVDNVSVREMLGGMGFGHTLIQNYYENF